MQEVYTCIRKTEVNSSTLLNINPCKFNAENSVEIIEQAEGRQEKKYSKLN